jgi:hypothetical protein
MMDIVKTWMFIEHHILPATKSKIGCDIVNDSY